jgi:hypothetical protein
VALGTLGLFLAVNEGFELMMAFFADVLEDWHAMLPAGLSSSDPQGLKPASVVGLRGTA